MSGKLRLAGRPPSQRDIVWLVIRFAGAVLVAARRGDAEIMPIAPQHPIAAARDENRRPAARLSRVIIDFPSTAGRESPAFIKSSGLLQIALGCFTVWQRFITFSISSWGMDRD